VHFANGLNENAIESIIEGLGIFKLNGNGQGMLAAAACQRLGAAYNASGDFDKAIAFYKQCLEIKAKLSGLQSLSVAEINHELGAVYFARGDFARAEELFRDSVEVKVKTLGEDSLEVASTVLFLGRVCLNMNSPDEAMMYFEQARLTKQLHLGDKHLECFEINRDIADTHQAKGEFEESLACYNSYLRARRSASGDDEIVADPLYSIGHIEQKLARLDEALKSFASALALYRVLLGDDHSNVAKTLFGLGLVYEA
jgi:tetratricopeptide (TPR) repeat protein